MPNKYPTRKHTTFILGEDVRAEANGKLILLGVYAGGFVRVFDEPTENEPARLRLVLTFVFRDGEGEFDTRATILDPDGETMVSIERGLMKKEPKASMIAGFGFAGQEFTKLGTYKATAYLDDKSYEFEFDIDLQADSEKPR